MKHEKQSLKQILFDKHPEYLQLCKQLPYGSAPQIRRKLIEKFGDSHAFTPNYINMVLDPENPRLNLDILDVAIEHLAEILVVNSRLKSLLKECSSKTTCHCKKTKTGHASKPATA